MYLQAGWSGKDLKMKEQAEEIEKLLIPMAMPIASLDAYRRNHRGFDFRPHGDCRSTE